MISKRWFWSDGRDFDEWRGGGGSGDFTPWWDFKGNFHKCKLYYRLTHGSACLWFVVIQTLAAPGLVVGLVKLRITYSAAPALLSQPDVALAQHQHSWPTDNQRTSLTISQWGPASGCSCSSLAFGLACPCFLTIEVMFIYGQHRQLSLYIRHSKFKINTIIVHLFQFSLVLFLYDSVIHTVVRLENELLLHMLAYGI